MPSKVTQDRERERKSVESYIGDEQNLINFHWMIWLSDFKTYYNKYNLIIKWYIYIDLLQIKNKL